MSVPTKASARGAGRRSVGAIVSTAALVVSLGACRGDGNTPPLHTAIDATSDVPSPDAGPIEASAAADGAESRRVLFFADGEGRAAIVARERKDHEAATAHLDSLLAAKGLRDDERAAAQLLRGLEHVHANEHAEAADRFAAARKAKVFASIDLWLRRLEAQARLDAGQPEVALGLIEDIDAKVWRATAVGSDVVVITADAQRRTDDLEGAEAGYRDYLKRYPKGSRRFEVRAKLATLLAERSDKPAQKEALDLYDGLLRGVPLSDYAEAADKAIPTLEEQVGPLRTGKEARDAARELAVLRAEAQLGRHRYSSAVKAVDGLLAKGKLSTNQRCRVWYVKGSSIFKQRRRADARPAFERADRECAKAGAAMETLRVKSRYQAARGWYASGHYTKAGEAFESLATEHPTHSYADDALVLAGESWESHGDDERAARAYRRAIGDHAGDMLAEARRRLLVMRFAAGDNEEILTIADAALAKRIARPAERAKLLYFRGRALDRLGRADEATAAWIEAVAAAPLDYPAVQALSRLRERGPEPLAQGLAKLGTMAGEVKPIARPQAEAMARAELLARLGLGDEARAELDHAKIEGWPAIAVLNQAGLYPAAQRAIANLGSAWRAEALGPDSRARWEGAYPQPFAEIIMPGEQEHAVPQRLTYAIMQTESRFDPGVTSVAGAKGLIQLMPATAAGLAKDAGVKLTGTMALHDPTLNLNLGMRYLGRLTARYGGGDAAVALAIPSYNAGAGSVDRWLGERGDWDLDLFIESIPYDETRRYTQSVLGRWFAYRWLYGEGEPAERIPYLPLKTPEKV